MGSYTLHSSEEVRCLPRLDSCLVTRVPHLSAAQIKDWLLERFPTLKVGDSTVRLYVKELRGINQIPKQNPQRTYQAVPELPMGQQIQVDWGGRPSNPPLKVVR